MSDTETPIHLVVGMVLDGVGDADERQRVREYIKQLQGERDELRYKLKTALGGDKPDKPATAKERARHWALEAAAQKERAEVAEAKLKVWEEAANSNDPYITNGGYVEVEVLEAVKRRNAELLAHAEEAEAKYQFELQYRLTLSRTVNAELKLLTASTQRAEKWKARAEALEERNDTTPLDAIKTVLEYSEFQGWSNAEALDAYRKLGDWLQSRA